MIADLQTDTTLLTPTVTLLHRWRSPELEDSTVVHTGTAMVAGTAVDTVTVVWVWVWGWVCLLWRVWEEVCCWEVSLVGSDLDYQLESVMLIA